MAWSGGSQTWAVQVQNRRPISYHHKAYYYLYKCRFERYIFEHTRHIIVLNVQCGKLWKAGMLDPTCLWSFCISNRDNMPKLTWLSDKQSNTLNINLIPSNYDPYPHKTWTIIGSNLQVALWKDRQETVRHVAQTGPVRTQRRRPLSYPAPLWLDVTAMRGGTPVLHLPRRRRHVASPRFTAHPSHK